MKGIIVGAGEVGCYLAEQLSQKGIDITVIEADPEQSQRVDESLDVKVFHGNGSSASMLDRAGVTDADMVLSVTSNDLTNLICCSLTKAMNADAVTVARVHDATYADHSLINYQLHFGIDHLVNPEALCAVELAKQIRNPGRVAVENLARGKVEVQQIEVTRHSRYTDKPLRELAMPDDVRVASVVHDGVFEVAGPETIIHPGDALTLFGKPDALAMVRSRFDADYKLNQVRIVLYGGTEIAIGLVRLLNNPRFRVRIIEKDAVCCKALAEQFPQVTVIHGDATSRRLLEEEQIGSCDYFVACTKRDEDNVMTCLQASKLGAKHVQLVINKPDYEPILQELKGALGLESVVSPRLATANELLHMISREPAVEVGRFAGTPSKLLEIKVSSRSPSVGKEIRELLRPANTIFVAIIHRFDARVPSASDRIMAGDRIIVLTTHEAEEAVVRLLA